jgi:MFS family permease
MAPQPTSGPASQVPVLLTAVFLAYLAQMTLNPIIAPLSREVGLAEWQIGVVISVAAVMVVVTSQRWGRASQSWGRKPVLVAALALAAASMGLFALSAWFGMTGVVSGAVLFVVFVMLRGVAFGTALAAVPPTAQAYIADVTTDEAARVKGIAGVGAMVVGSVVGGVLAAFGLITPLLVVPVLLLGGLGLVILRLRREPATLLVERPASVRPWDPRVWPFLVSGFGMFTALGFIQVITGFVVQDRLGLTSEQTGLVTGGALLTAGIGMVLAQAVIVPRSGWAPPRLLRVGSAVAVRALRAQHRGRPAVRRGPPDRARARDRDARLRRGAFAPDDAGGTGRTRGAHRRHERSDVRGRAHAGHGPVRALGTPADPHRRRRDGGRARVRPRAPAHARGGRAGARLRVIRIRRARKSVRGPLREAGRARSRRIRPGRSGRCS